MDGDCRALGASLEYDCRSFRECPVGMQEVRAPWRCWALPCTGTGASWPVLGCREEDVENATGSRPRSQRLLGAALSFDSVQTVT